MIEEGLDAMEEIWLSPDTLAKVRNGDLPELLAAHSTTSDFFDLDATDAAL
jgi:RHH-type rel operon transcriptional repressor/antitoxin RelB